MNIALTVLNAIAYAVIKSPYVFILIISGLMFYVKNKKTVIMQKVIIGDKLNSPLELTISQLVMGIFAGSIISIILGYFGVVFSENSAVELIFVISILLMIINSRFICFSYSAGILGFISVLLEMLRKFYGINIDKFSFLNIDVAALMTLIAVMHFIEGLLVMVDGEKGAIPVFTSTNEKIIGGFAFKRYWAVPIALGLIVKSNYPIFTDVIHFNNWDTILKFTTPMSILKGAVLILYPIYGMIGYSSVTFTKSKREKTFISGSMIMIYGVLLFIFARLSVLNIFFKLFVVIFAPVAHEGIIYIQRYKELNSKPKYISDENGIMVLEVAPNSLAFDMGIKSGDILIEVNNKKISKEDDIFETIKEASNYIWFKIKKAAGNLEEVNYKKVNQMKRLGIVFVPTVVPSDRKMVKINEENFKEILDKIRDKNNK